MAGATFFGFGSNFIQGLVVLDDSTATGLAPALGASELRPGPVNVIGRDTRTNESFVLQNGVTYFVPLRVTGVSPAEVSYLGKTPLTIHGQGFTAATSIFIDGIAIPVEVVHVDGTATLRGTTPAHAPTAEPVAVRAVDPAGGEALLDGALTYLGPLQVRAAEPNELEVGNHTSVIITGIGFTPETAIEIDGLLLEPGAEVTYVDPRTLNVSAPGLDAGEYDIVAVDTLAGAETRATLERGLTYIKYEEGDPSFRLRACAKITCTFGRLHGRDAALLGLVVFSVYVFVLAPCLAAVRSASM